MIYLWLWWIQTKDRVLTVQLAVSLISFVHLVSGHSLQ